jgi:hypothetical protein
MGPAGNLNLNHPSDSESRAAARRRNNDWVLSRATAFMQSRWTLPYVTPSLAPSLRRRRPRRTAGGPVGADNTVTVHAALHLKTIRQ